MSNTTNTILEEQIAEELQSTGLYECTVGHDKKRTCDLCRELMHDLSEDVKKEMEERSS